MDKRLVRARAKIRDAGIAFTAPDRSELPDRLAAAHAVVYLVFTEGHLASGDGPAVRADLCDEAVWLAGQLHTLAPQDPETTGLLALLLIQNARTAARQDELGRLVTFADQDRSRWDAAAVAQAKRLLATTGRGPIGPYQVQAAIALLHAVAPDADHVEWSRIADLYGVLSRLAPSPVVEVNRAVALGRADGAPAGLAVLAPVLAATAHGVGWAAALPRTARRPRRPARAGRSTRRGAQRVAPRRRPHHEPRPAGGAAPARIRHLTGRPTARSEGAGLHLLMVFRAVAAVCT